MDNKLNVTNQVFGYQLLLDLYGCREGVCDDLTLCYNFLDEIVGRLGMEKQAPPNIFRSDEVRFPDKAGLSGWVPLIESSVVIHTLSPKNFISIDVYCCRSFDLEKAKDMCRAFFAPKNIDEQFIERGMDYYKSDTNYHTLVVDRSHGPTPEVTINPKEASVALNK
jgi:S-adenosylmethionine decarboxylase